MNKVKYILIILIFLVGCKKSAKEDFIDYKKYDSYPLWESEDLLIETNKWLAQELESCNQEAKQIILLTNDIISQIDLITSIFINNSGGLDPKTGALVSRGNVVITERFFLDEDNGKKLVEALKRYFQELKKYGLSIDIRHRYYEQSWKHELTFEQYLFQYEKPEQIMETLNRVKLRILIEVNQYLVKKIKEC